jgi:hypothetical protein
MRRLGSLVIYKSFNTLLLSLISLLVHPTEMKINKNHRQSRLGIVVINNKIDESLQALPHPYSVLHVSGSVRVVTNLKNKCSIV